MVLGLGLPLKKFVLLSKIGVDRYVRAGGLCALYLRCEVLMSCVAVPAVRMTGSSS